MTRVNLKIFWIGGWLVGAIRVMKVNEQ